MVEKASRRLSLILAASSFNAYCFESDFMEFEKTSIWCKSGFHKLFAHLGILMISGNLRLLVDLGPIFIPLDALMVVIFHGYPGPRSRQRPDRL